MEINISDIISDILYLIPVIIALIFFGIASICNLCMNDDDDDNDDDNNNGNNEKLK